MAPSQGRVMSFSFYGTLHDLLHRHLLLTFPPIVYVASSAACGYPKLSPEEWSIIF